jgi:hypothetical protein
MYNKPIPEAWSMKPDVVWQEMMLQKTHLVKLSAASLFDQQNSQCRVVLLPWQQQRSEQSDRCLDANPEHPMQYGGWKVSNKAFRRIEIQHPDPCQVRLGDSKGDQAKMLANRRKGLQ